MRFWGFVLLDLHLFSERCIYKIKLGFLRIEESISLDRNFSGALEFCANFEIRKLSYPCLQFSCFFPFASSDLFGSYSEQTWTRRELECESRSSRQLSPLLMAA